MPEAPAPAHSQDREAPPRKGRALVLACVMGSMFMAAIEVTIVATAMPEIVRSLGDFTLYAWVFSAFLMAQAATTVIYGRLADLFGRRPVLVAGILVFLVGSLLCGLAWSMPSLIAFRLVQGLGAGAIQPVSMTIVGDLYTAEERPRIQGWLASVWGVSAVVGPLAGGLIVERLSWHWVFWINIPLGLATVAGLMLFLREEVARRRVAIDVPGALLCAAGIALLLLAITGLGEGAAPLSARVAWPALGFLAAFALFLWQESRAESPMVPLRLWTGRLMAAANGATLLAGLAMIGVTSLLPIYVQGVLGRSALVSGFALTAMAVGWPLATSLSSHVFRRVGTRGTARLGGLLLLLGGGAMPLLLGPDSPVVLAGLLSFVIGAGMGLLSVTCIVLIQSSVDWSLRGAATASNVFARILGNTLGAALLAGVMNIGLQRHLAATGAAVEPERLRRLLGEPGGGGGGIGDPALQAALMHGLHLAFWAILVLGALTFLAALLIPQRDLAAMSRDASGGGRGRA